MEKCVEFEYEDPARSTEEVGHDTVKSLTVATNMLHYHRTRPQLRTTVTAHMFGLARRLLLIPTGLTLMRGCWPDVSEASVASTGMAGVTRLCSVSRILWRASPQGTDARAREGESPITPVLFHPLLVPCSLIHYWPKLVPRLFEIQGVGK